MKHVYAIQKSVFDKMFSDEYFKRQSNLGCFISILDFDNNEQLYDKTIDNFLQVKMWDIEEDLFEDGELSHEKPSDTELQKIVMFVNNHKDKKVFVVHCSAGISRSGAVARFIAEKFADEVDYREFVKENKYILPNLYVLNRLKSLDSK